MSDGKLLVASLRVEGGITLLRGWDDLSGGVISDIASSGPFCRLQWFGNVVFVPRPKYARKLRRIARLKRISDPNRKKWRAGE